MCVCLCDNSDVITVSLCGAIWPVRRLSPAQGGVHGDAAWARLYVLYRSAHVCDGGKFDHCPVCLCVLHKIQPKFISHAFFFFFSFFLQLTALRNHSQKQRKRKPHSLKSKRLIAISAFFSAIYLCFFYRFITPDMILIPERDWALARAFPNQAAHLLLPVTRTKTTNQKRPRHQRPPIREDCANGHKRNNRAAPLVMCVALTTPAPASPKQRKKRGGNLFIFLNCCDYYSSKSLHCIRKQHSLFWVCNPKVAVEILSFEWLRRPPASHTYKCGSEAH